MARTVQDAKLDSRNARDKLKTRARPYYKMLIPGTLHLGYRRRRSGKGAQGRWLVRRYVGLDTKGIGRYRERDIGLADDFLDADGGTILNYAQAQQRALEWYPASDDGKKTPAGPLTVRDAIDRYLTALERVKASVAIPIIASLNASSVGGWVTHARRIQDAGADALELNLYHVAADPRRSASDMEARDLDLIAAVRASITIPLAVKLSPYYSAFANFAAAAIGAGADGLVVFNRF